MKANEKQELLIKIEELKRKVEQLDKKKGRFIPKRHEEYFFVANSGTISSTIFLIETKHRRNAVTHPQWLNYLRAYEMTWTKHYTNQTYKTK